jgi:hypothetical protein
MLLSRNVEQETKPSFLLYPVDLLFFTPVASLLIEHGQFVGYKLKFRIKFVVGSDEGCDAARQPPRPLGAPLEHVGYNINVLNISDFTYPK